MAAPVFLAFCIITGTLKGRINLRQQGDIVRIEGRVDNIPSGLHGFHVHEFGNLNNGCIAAGAHFNPAGLTHGGPHDLIRHAGDLGNIEVNSSRIAFIDITDNKISLDPKNNLSVLNRALVIHANPDDLGRGMTDESLKTGNAGGRIGCCVITHQTVNGNPKRVAELLTIFLSLTIYLALTSSYN